MLNSKYIKCNKCGHITRLTQSNPSGICPAYACENNRYFYEDTPNKDAYNKRMALTEKYKSLYLEYTSDLTLHFLYGLDKGNMLFISDTDYHLYVINETELISLANKCDNTNYFMLIANNYELSS